MSEKREEMENDVFGLDDIEIENTSVDEIDAEDVNLIFVGIDRSGSMSPYEMDGSMKDSMTNFKTSLQDSKEADQILVARADFDDRISVGGYKRIDEFDTSYTASGMTSLYDVICEGVKKLHDYRDYLKSQGMRVKAVFAIFSDGDDTSSHNLFHDAKKAIDYLNSEEITTAFISFGGNSTEATNLGFENILSVSSSASELRKAFNCLSKSVIESSKSVLPDGNDFFDV